MKNMRKALSLFVCVLLAAGAFTGCRRTEPGEEPRNEDATQLLVGNFDGGYGDAWLKEVKARFEEKYKNVSFEEGKTGVQVIIDTNDKYQGSAVAQQIVSWPQHVILAEAIDYYQIVGTNAKRTKVADITDVVTTPMNYDFITGGTDPSLPEETYTIESIMNPSMKEYFRQESTEKYYGVPFYEATVGFVYDIDLFEEYGFYYCADGYGDSAGFAQDAGGNWMGKGGAVLGAKGSMTFDQAKAAGMKLSDGPDGRSGTYDDGMPATYDEFFALCERIEARGCEALTWPGEREVQRYLNYLAYNLWADYEGAEQMQLNYSLSGTATDLVDMTSFDAATGKFNTYSETITDANGYLLGQQAGKYYAVDFIKRLVSNTNCYDESNCFTDGVTQYSTETLFVNSAYPNDNLKSRAMMIDGSWWQSEASQIFEDMAEAYGDEWKAENRRFGMLALPKATEAKVGTASTRAFNTSTAILINVKTTGDENILKLAKQFIKFMHTHESLYQFNKVTGTAKPYDYTLSDEELSTLTSVAKQNYEMHSSTDYVFSYSQNPIVRADIQYFCSSGYYVFQANDSQFEILSLSFKENPSWSSWDYFSSMVTDRGQAWWTSKFASYLG